MIILKKIFHLKLWNSRLKLFCKFSTPLMAFEEILDPWFGSFWIP